MGQSPKLPPKTVLQTAGALPEPSRPQPSNSRGENGLCKREGRPGPTPAALGALLVHSRAPRCVWGLPSAGGLSRAGGSGGSESSVLPVAAAAAAAIKKKKGGGRKEENKNKFKNSPLAGMGK